MRFAPQETRTCLVTAVTAQRHLYWEKDAEDPHMENRGNLTRVRLEGDHQTIVHRIIDYLSEAQRYLLHDQFA